MQTICDAMIAWHQMSLDVLGHHMVRNVTKFQCCKRDN